MIHFLPAIVEKDILQRQKRMETTLNTFGDKIDSDADYLEACQFLRNAQTFKVEIQAKIDPEKSTRHQAHKDVCAYEDQLLDPIEQGMAYLSSLIADYRARHSNGAPSGIRFDESFSARVVDMRALLRAILDGQVPLGAVVPNQRWLDNMAKKYKTALGYPGVKVEKSTTVVARKFAEGERDGKV